MNRKILTDFILVCKRHAGYKAMEEELSKRKNVLAEMVKEDFIEDTVTSQKMSDVDLGYRMDVLVRDEIVDLAKTGAGIWSMLLPDGRTVAQLVLGAIHESKDALFRHEPHVKQATPYLAKDVYGSAADGDKARLIEVLENFEENGAHPYRELVKKDIHHKTLQSIANEMIERRNDGRGIPPAIEKALKITEDFKAKVRFG